MYIGAQPVKAALLLCMRPPSQQELEGPGPGCCLIMQHMYFGPQMIARQRQVCLKIHATSACAL